MTRKEIKILSPTGILGYGFPKESLEGGMELKPDFIGCDAGSADGGPFYLGEGKPFVSRNACKRDTELLLKAALEAKIPLLIGSAGGNGGQAGVDFLLGIVREIAAENSLHFNLGVVNCEQNKEYLKNKLRLGKIASMGLLPELTEKDIDDAQHIVGLMGIEVFNQALDLGADVVIAGRTSDTAIFAAIPFKRGFDPGLAWHAAKILECGAASTEAVSAGDVILATITDDCFYVEPINPKLRHTVLSVAAHSLYENSSPFHLYEPGGMLDLTDTKYDQFDERTVKVWGSRFIPAEKYFIKLESAVKIGYRTIAIMGTRDPILISQIDDYIEIVKSSVRDKVKDVLKGHGPETDYVLSFKIYGNNAIMGDLDPIKATTSHELGIVLEVVAGTQEVSAAVLALARTYCLHNHFPGRMCISGNMAVAFSPSDIPMGPVYRFNMEHLIELDDPLELVSIKVLNL